MGRLAKRWEGRAERFLSELNARGETRLEEISRKIKQTEAWLRLIDATEKVEERRSAARAKWTGLGNQVLGRAGIATDAQISELSEELRMLSWRLDRISKKLQENSMDPKGESPPENDIRSLA